MSCEISDSFIDIHTIGNFKLCCYSHCLVFGKPIYEDFQLKFASNTYLKIYSHQYFRYFDFFNNVLQITKEIEESKENVELSIVSPLLSLATNCVTYIYQTKENEETTVLIQSKYEENIRFILTLEEVHEFFLGFRNLCFKLFCYPIKIEEQIFRILHSESFTFLKNINKEDNITMQCSNEFTKNEMVLLQQVLLRHHTLLLKIKCSLDNFSDEVTL